MSKPVIPSHSVLRPLGLDSVRLCSGFWGDFQTRNAEAVLPHCQTWIERSHKVGNLRAAAEGRLPAARQGREFADSDVYKVLEALAWESGRRGGAPELDAAIDSLAAVVAAAQEPDGYLNTKFGRPGQAPRYSDLEWGHELYCYGHLIQAGVARLRCHGEDLLTQVARRAADHLCDRFADAGICGHPEIETALVELYRVTGEERYLAQASAFVERRGRGSLADIEWGRVYYQDDVPVRERSAFAGHAVRELYLAAGVVDVAVETGDRSLLDAIVGQWERSVAARTYLTGATGSRHAGEAFGEDFELPPDRAYGETCAAIAMVQLCWRLTLATGEARFADLAERTLFNVVAASPDLAGTTFFYSNPLQVRRPGSPQDHDVVNLSPSAGLRSPWFDVPCCPPNVARLLASLGAYQATESDGGVQLHQLTASTVHASGLSLTVDTGYPWDGDVVVRIDAAADDRPVALSVRVPGWASGASGATVETPDGGVRAAEPGYLTEHRIWRAGDELRLRLPVTPRWTWPDSRVDAARGCVAVERGPLVYCAESVDHEDISTLSVDVHAPLKEAAVPLLGADAVAVVASGATAAVPDADWPYGEAPDTVEGSDTPVTLVPYHLWANRGPAAMRVFLPVA